MVNSRHKIAGVVLAGGQSRRYGANKAFVPLGGASLISHVIERAAPQVAVLLVSAGDDARFAALGLPIVTDDVHEREGGQAGPLAGILAALDWVAEREPSTRWLATFSVDTPMLPADMVARLLEAAEGETAEIACCRSAGRLHPLLALWSPDLRGALRAALADGERAVHRFVQQRRLAIVDFSTEPFDPFTNVNTPADLERLVQQSDVRQSP